MCLFSNFISYLAISFHKGIETQLVAAVFFIQSCRHSKMLKHVIKMISDFLFKPFICYLCLSISFHFPSNFILVIVKTDDSAIANNKLHAIMMLWLMMLWHQ